MFHPVEQALLCDWLGRERLPQARGITREVASPGDGPITGEPSCYGDINEFTLANAVARLVLGGIQQRLPTSAVCYGDDMVLTRDYRKKPERKLDMLPWYLFQINWASSAPGISWPEAYYVTWLPLYEVFVVTGSVDSPEARGYCDCALGWFGADTPLEAGVKRVITGDWKRQFDAHEQP